MTSQQATVQELPSDAQQLILMQLTNVEAPTETEELYLAAENIRNFFAVNKRWQRFNTPSMTEKIIKELAKRYTGGDITKAAHALGTYSAGRWLVQYLTEKEKKAGQILSLPSFTPLMIAVSRGYKNMVNDLISQGADVNENNEQGETALMIAAADCDIPSTVQALIDAGAQINATDDFKNTALFRAVINQCVENIKILTQAGARVDIRSMDGQTPLAIASTDGNVVVVNALLDAHANPNLAINRGFTPLMNAVEEGHLDVVQALLDHGALVTIKNENDQTALDIARDAEGEHRDEIIKLLHEAQKQQGGRKPKRKKEQK